MWIITFECRLIEFVPEGRDRSTFWMEVSCDELYERGLPSSTCTDECGLFSFLDRERKIRKDLRVVVAVGDIFDLDVLVLWGKSEARIVSTDRSERIKSRPKLFYRCKMPRNSTDRS